MKRIERKILLHKDGRPGYCTGRPADPGRVSVRVWDPVHKRLASEEWSVDDLQTPLLESGERP